MDLTKVGNVMERLFADFSGMFLVIFFLLMSSSIGMAQISEAEAIKRGGANGCVAGMFPDAPQFRRFIRREDLEDQLFSLSARDLTAPTKPAYLFEVYSTGTYITEKNEVNDITSTGWDHKLIAVSKLGDVYPLFGCDEKRSAFQDLVRHSKISVGSAENARSFGLLFYRLVEDPELKRMVFYSWEVRHRTEDYFLRQYEEKEAEGKFKRWKKSWIKAHLPRELGIAAVSSGQGFSVIIHFLEFQTQMTPRVKQDELTVGRTGEYELKKSTYLF
jgi:hypothetical protein